MLGERGAAHRDDVARDFQDRFTSAPDIVEAARHDIRVKVAVRHVTPDRVVEPVSLERRAIQIDRLGQTLERHDHVAGGLLDIGMCLLRRRHECVHARWNGLAKVEQSLGAAVVAREREMWIVLDPGGGQDGLQPASAASSSPLISICTRSITDCPEGRVTPARLNASSGDGPKCARVHVFDRSNVQGTLAAPRGLRLPSQCRCHHHSLRVVGST